MQGQQEAACVHSAYATTGVLFTVPILRIKFASTVTPSSWVLLLSYYTAITHSYDVELVKQR